MKFSGLQAFVAVVNAGSLRTAAQRLGVSQPALTKLMRELEISSGASLLTRSSKGVTPTGQGLVLYEHASKIEHELSLARARIKALAGTTAGEIRVAAMPLAVVTLIPEAIRTFSREFPHVKFRVQEELYADRCASLRAGSVDLTIGELPAAVAKGEFSVTPLMQTAMVIVTRKASSWAGATSLRQLQTAPWIYTAANRETGYAAELYAAHGLLPPHCGAMVNSTLAMLSLLSQGDHLALLPLQLARHPWAQLYLSQVPVAEGYLELNIGAITGSSSVLPVVRSFIVHLERAVTTMGSDLGA